MATRGDKTTEEEESRQGKRANSPSSGNRGARKEVRRKVVQGDNKGKEGEEDNRSQTTTRSEKSRERVEL